MLKTGANPGALPPIAEAPLSSVPSLVRGRPDEEGVPRDDMEHRDYDVFISHASEDRHFEFVVSDKGIDILASLGSCPDYVSLNDHGEALSCALQDGISRHGVAAGRGMGFRQLFIGLANLNGALRFHSGDHTLTIDGRSPTLMTAKLAQKPHIRGFIASVSCSL